MSSWNTKLSELLTISIDLVMKIGGSYDNKIQFWKLNIDENLFRDDFNLNDLEFKYE